MVILEKQAWSLFRGIYGYPIPGYGEQRINTVMQTGGFQLLANTLQTNFGVYPTQYAMIDMVGFMEVIDVLGGIDVTTDQYTGDACETYLNPNKWCEVYPGTVSMDRNWALWYVRARYNSSDFDRMRRNQEVTKAIFDKATTPAGLLKMPQLLDIFESQVDSNINPDQIMPMVRFARNFNSNEDVRRFTIGPNETTGWTTPMGASVLLPNVPAIQAILQEALTFD
jgi:polyisoprenyl-teichoic acid--peptidoglycan teichoic acid transferase